MHEDSLSEVNHPHSCWSGFLREAEPAPPASLAAFAGKRILITGAGGYIGSALVRALSICAPERLLLVDIVEAGLYELEQEFSESAASRPCEFLVGSVCDQVFLTEIFERYRPQIVFHAAALKHVPLMEENPFAAVETNVLGTLAMVETAASAGAERLILLSTDKAVDPISIMGATKRVAELIVLAKRSSPRMHALRLGNVLGSTGSVAPLFTRQIEQGKPLTVTHADTTRYFLSIEAAVSALLLAASREYDSGLLIPETGPPYRIVDLARFLLAAAARDERPGSLRYTGLRSGDKLHEQMISAQERVRGTAADHTTLQQVESPAIPSACLRECVDRMEAAVRSRDLDRLLSALTAAVPEYLPGESLRSRTGSLPRLA